MCDYDYTTTGLVVLSSGPANQQQSQIVRAFQHAWMGYCKHAWGRDELKPKSKGWIDWLGVGVTIIDSLDTMLIMGLKDGLLILLMLCNHNCKLQLTIVIDQILSTPIIRNQGL